MTTLSLPLSAPAPPDVEAPAPRVAIAARPALAPVLLGIALPGLLGVSLLLVPAGSALSALLLAGVVVVAATAGWALNAVESHRRTQQLHREHEEQVAALTDHLLVAVARRLRAVVRGRDTAGRMSGEQLLVGGVPAARPLTWPILLYAA